MRALLAVSLLFGILLSVATWVPAASAAGVGKVNVTCSDGTGYSVGTPATFGQNTANAAFNAANPLGITCSVS